jgi:L,D-peptidoglycan transpeptidase YkuD (ErfK/YbiS/YcfS/YnhG family)
MKLLGCLLVSLVALSVLCAQVKKPVMAAVKTSFAESLQVVAVTTRDWNATTGRARLFERKDLHSKWKAVGDEFPVVVGRTGLAWARDSAPEKAIQFKNEGDGKSPAGMFPLTFAFGSSIQPEQVTLPYTRLEQYTECVDDVASRHYNTIVDRMKVGNFDWKSSEKMLAVGPQYDVGVFVAYNSYPTRRGEGSCIFLHVWKDPASATSGCTAMQRSRLERILTWLEPKSNPYLVQLPEKEYKELSRAWNLPKM